ncbi:hypothetical protein EUX98_g2453 [Antrodiella citrinella]|uniref:Glucose-methanol-choline oxidoreductase N-terminal domain-containing protein n=1 Tax=Antrodiella citrinella TaxID=2447956 RepID=A0A4S4N139_9APHY|nr:hypothetical protein EUX98_g2453 [Antrodiella citrinella]
MQQSHSEEYDIVFAGGGAAGCLIAGRLAAADPSLKILVVEAGPHTLDDPAHVQVARFMSHMVPGSKTEKFIISNPSDQLGGRVAIVPAGQCVGGGSSVNFGMYNRAAASEFNDWESKFNNPGWGSQDLIPLLKKTETYEIDPNAETHGQSGPLNVSYAGAIPNVCQDFLDVGQKYDTERKFTRDPNDLTTVNAYARWPKWINGKTGRRSDVPHAFIYSQQHNKNLRVLAGFFVRRVIILGDTAEIEKWSAQFTKDGSGTMLSNGLEAGVKFRPNEDELRTIGPAFTAKWKSFYVDYPDRPIMWYGGASFGFGLVEEPSNEKYFAVGHWISHPSALGHVHITSGEDPSANPDFTPRYLEHEEDMEQHVFGYKRDREFARRMACFRGEYPPRQPVFPPGSAAAVNELPVPVDMNAPDIVYTKEDDEAIRDFVRKNVGTTWHALGTCSMMPRDDGGVVDSHLNVYGVKSLKVADLSIAPSNVNGNTYSTALVIAEKAAVIIAQELGILNV